MEHYRQTISTLFFNPDILTNIWTRKLDIRIIRELPFDLFENAHLVAIRNLHIEYAWDTADYMNVLDNFHLFGLSPHDPWVVTTVPYPFMLADVQKATEDMHADLTFMSMMVAVTAYMDY